MADETTIIGRSAHVRGKLTGEGDLEIYGRVDGDVVVEGEVTVEQGGLVGSNVTARRIIVRGAVKGDLVAEEAVVLEEGARVVGDVRAPRVAVEVGALLRGHVQAGAASGAARPAAARAAAVAPRAVAKPAPASAPARQEAAPQPSRGSNGSAARPAPPPAPVSRERVEAAVVEQAARRVEAPPPRVMTLAGGAPTPKLGPPPPSFPR